MGEWAVKKAAEIREKAAALAAFWKIIRSSADEEIADFNSTETGTIEKNFSEPGEFVIRRNNCVLTARLNAAKAAIDLMINWVEFENTGSTTSRNQMSKVMVETSGLHSDLWTGGKDGNACAYALLDIVMERS